MTSTITLYAGDNRVSLRRLIDQGVRVHSCVTDAPYGLTSVTKRFGKEGSAPAKHGTNGAFSRASGGFMGKVWDGTGIERDPEFWRLIHDILLPGGFVFAFSGSRTGHWQACAMETAGFIMHPMHGWVYGSGMPKAHNPKVEGFEGWRHGTQSQKPALEPIYLGQKPYDQKTGALNLLKHGVGAVNIDACRVGWPRGVAPEVGTPGWGGPQKKSTAAPGQEGETVDRLPPSPLGRWPANLIHDGSEAVIGLFPHTSSGTGAVKRKSAAENQGNTGAAYGAESRPEGAEMISYGDEGSTARFFHGFTLTDEDYAWAIAAGLIDDVPALLEPIRYQGKAKKSDRAGSKHPTVKPVALMEYCITHLTPKGGTVLDPFAGSGTTGEAAKRLGFDCILMEAEPDYIDFLRQRFDLRADDEDELDLLADDEELDLLA